ncbi:MORN repeat-containing protein [Snuella sedimenti]|uniref:MORN repeat protein n=1 Tax=Snuella sedimenti TaxID=2798802 RepID=A0A8J7LP73_9FLAO|nr:hypothetical protein [Snuella sedimenti]MBJ6368938.1 hypothetical protein [Snuella sedimenti]
MKTLFSIIVLNLLFIQFSLSQSTCVVKLEAINQSYTGECKKGLANGKGEAYGIEDSYKGGFKKGLPHGYGTYKWGNGDSYTGEFSKGKMDGKGKLILKNESSGEVAIQSGYFEKGIYLGKYKYAYAVISKREIKNIFAREDPSIITAPDINVIRISFKYNGRQIIPSIVNISDSGKSLVERDGAYMIMKNVQFPNKQIEVTFRTEEGFNGRVVLDIYKKANWSVEITI